MIMNIIIVIFFVYIKESLFFKLQAQSAFNQCEKCGKGFHRKSSFEGHLMAHNDIRLEICPHPNCARKFRSTSHLNRHLQSHVGI